MPQPRPADPERGADQDGRRARQALERSGQGRRRPSGPASAHTVLVWLQSDLRLDDHEALCQANGGAAALLPVYVFDPRDYEKVTCLVLSLGPMHLRVPGVWSCRVTQAVERCKCWCEVCIHHSSLSLCCGGIC